MPFRALASPLLLPISRNTTSASSYNFLASGRRPCRHTITATALAVAATARRFPISR